MQARICWILALGCLPLAATRAAAGTGAGTAATPGQLIAAMRAAAAALEDYQVTGESVSDGKRQRFQFFFKKPDLVRINTRRGQVTVQPNGKICGRLGRSQLGGIWWEIGRNDKRLRDSEGIPFWDTHFAAIVDRIARRLQSGAAAAVESGADTCTLTVCLENTSWTYVIDSQTLFFRETSRSMDGQEVERTRYSNFRANSGLRKSLFSRF